MRVIVIGRRPLEFLLSRYRIGRDIRKICWFDQTLGQRLQHMGYSKWDMINASFEIINDSRAVVWRMMIFGSILFKLLQKDKFVQENLSKLTIIKA